VRNEVVFLNIREKHLSLSLSLSLRSILSRQKSIKHPSWIFAPEVPRISGKFSTGSSPFARALGCDSQRLEDDLAGRKKLYERAITGTPINASSGRLIYRPPAAEQHRMGKYANEWNDMR
jgi:hypothetical protein